MKSLLPLVFIVFALATTVKAQITITQADMPQAGDTIRLSTTIDTAGLPAPALTGAGITWDYSKLMPFLQNIDTFLSVPFTPAYQLFFNDAILYPAYKSTVTQTAPDFSVGPVKVTNVINFYTDQSSNYESVGFGANINAITTPVQDDTIDVIYNFPMNYSNSDSCHSSYHISIPTLGYYGLSQYRINYVDGWGKLITPFGTFSTLKVKTIIYSSDTVYIDAFKLGFRNPQTEQIQYKWLANGQHVPLLQINENVEFGKPVYVNTVYRDSARRITLGIAGISTSFNNVSLYPNPSKENTTLSYYLNNSSPVNIAIYSVEGRCVSNVFTGDQQAGNHNLNMSVLNLQPGIYSLKIEANGQQAVKKLVVVK